MTDDAQKLNWIPVAKVDEMANGRVRTVTAGTVSLALCQIDGQLAAMLTAASKCIRSSSTTMTYSLVSVMLSLIKEQSPI